MSSHGKTDSDATSQEPSSPNRAVYYVQSPSRDSHDGEKTTNSFHSTPVISPMGSPPHSHSNSSLGPHSRESSSTRFSASTKSDRKNTRAAKPWNKGFDAIEEECLLDGGGAGAHARRRCYVLAFVLGFSVLFASFSLILYAASRSQKPSIAMKSISFDEFVIQAGEDSSGVATELVSMNATVKLSFRNSGTFFGLHVTATPLDLSFSQLTLGSGTIDKFYQSRKSRRSVTVSVKGSKIPLYGGGASLSSLNGQPIGSVPLSLNFMVRSRAYVLGKLVKPKFYKKVECSVVMDPKKMDLAVSLKNKCIYQ